MVKRPELIRYLWRLPRLSVRMVRFCGHFYIMITILELSLDKYKFLGEIKN